MCQNIGYNLTSTSNMFNQTQEEAKHQVNQFWPVISTNCSPDLRFFACSLYVPMCQTNVAEQGLPCRSICERVRNCCEPVMRHFGFSWPDQMRCENLPNDGVGESCLGSNRTVSNCTYIIPSLITVLPTEMTVATNVTAQTSSVTQGIPKITVTPYPNPTSGVRGGPTVEVMGFRFLTLATIVIIGQIPM